MNSLVGYGVSSDSDSDGDGDTGPVNFVKEEDDKGTPATKTRNFLLESGSASSDSGSESEKEDRDCSSPSPQHRAAPATGPAALPSPSPACLTSYKLPPPTLNANSDSSVFANPFKTQAEQKLNALQKHVPLTLEAKPSQIGGKRMCVSYRKDGRCRFGIKCKFAHDSDLQTPVIPSHHHPPAGDDHSAEHAEPHAGGSSGGARSQKHPEEEESGGPQVKKRRVGLSNTLIPPKKAMKQFAMLRDRERLNMS